MSTPYVPTLLGVPQQSPEHATYWEAAREGRLMIKTCCSCGKTHWYPRALCPFCMGDTEWKQASGQGTVYSFSITRRAGPNPFCIAYVTLEEGVTMLTRIVDCDLDTVRIGQKVQVKFVPTQDEEGPPVPVFAPV